MTPFVHDVKERRAEFLTKFGKLGWVDRDTLIFWSPRRTLPPD